MFKCREGSTICGSKKRGINPLMFGVKKGQTYSNKPETFSCRFV